ncbi:hydroxyisourate hydrolase, partial [Streptomyces sp. NPDC059766]
MSTGTTASVSTHILDTSVGRPAEGVAVLLAARGGRAPPTPAHRGAPPPPGGRGTARAGPRRG